MEYSGKSFFVIVFLVIVFLLLYFLLLYFLLFSCYITYTHFQVSFYLFFHIHE